MRVNCYKTITWKSVWMLRRNKNKIEVAIAFHNLDWSDNMWKKDTSNWYYIQIKGLKWNFSIIIIIVLMLKGENPFLHSHHFTLYSLLPSHTKHFPLFLSVVQNPNPDPGASLSPLIDFNIFVVLKCVQLSCWVHVPCLVAEKRKVKRNNRIFPSSEPVVCCLYCMVKRLSSVELKEGI